MGHPYRPLPAGLDASEEARPEAASPDDVITPSMDGIEGLTDGPAKLRFGRDLRLVEVRHVPFLMCPSLQFSCGEYKPAC